MEGLSRDVWARNGALLVLPPLVISLGLWPWLPESFAPESFSRGIPRGLLLAEHVFRIAVFALPGALCFGLASRPQQLGLRVYLLGLLLYLGSYLALIWAPASLWSSSAFGFTAPAWTPALWLMGVALMCRESWMLPKWRWWIYLAPVLVFEILHLAHTSLVWARLG